MALDAAHRASIYEKLRPVLGDEDANVLMSEFPSIEAQELVTKDFLRAELAGFRTELRDDLAALRADFDGLRTEVAQLESTFTLRIGAAVAAQSGVMVGLLALFR